MNSVKMRCYGNLNYFLEKGKRQKTFMCFFNGRTSVKDLVESAGVPHTEIDLILIDGESAGFDRLVEGGEHVAVYPVFEELDISNVSKVHVTPPAPLRFVLDVHLGKLASYLRMLGIDTVYANDAADEELAVISENEKRVLLTFDRNLLKRNRVTYGYCVRSRDPKLQVKEVFHRFNLYEQADPFRRCTVCNGELVEVEKSEVESQLPDNVRNTMDEFYLCKGCRRVYWKGSHYEDMKKVLEELIRDAENTHL